MLDVGDMLAELRHRFASTERRGSGVVARTLLCRRTAPCDRSGGQRWAGLQARACGSSFEACIASELAGVTARWSGRLDSMRFAPAFHGPASLLRWDLPLAIFAPDSCPCAACHCPREDLPGAIGLLFRELPPERHAFAFAHDGFTDDPKERRKPCDYARLGRGHGDAEDASQRRQQAVPHARTQGQPAAAPRRVAARAYAAARLAAMRRGRRATERLLSEGDWSCYHRGVEDAVRWQREFALALSLQQPSSSTSIRPVDRSQRRWLCPSAALGAYNQLHVSWNRSMLAAVFYVNATGVGTDSRERLPTTTTATTAQLLASAEAARAAALRVSELSGHAGPGSSDPSRGLGERSHDRLPLVQLRLGRACEDARRANGTTPRQRRELAHAALVAGS